MVCMGWYTTACVERQNATPPSVLRMNRRLVHLPLSVCTSSAPVTPSCVSSASSDTIRRISASGSPLSLACLRTFSTGTRSAMMIHSCSSRFGSCSSAKYSAVLSISRIFSRGVMSVTTLSLGVRSSKQYR